MSRRGTATILLMGTVVLIALLFTGIAGGSVVIAYVLFVAATLLAFVLCRLRAILPPAEDFEAVARRVERGERPVDHLQAFKLRLAVASSTQSDLHFQLRQRVRRIVSARLSYRYGIDLEREPERAGDVMQGSRTWGLIRPDREFPEDDLAPGRPELEQLVDELEDL